MGQIYASSDWHGCSAVANKILNYLQPEDKLYFLGDATDRGLQGADILDLLIARPNTYYIKGNHDYMMAATLPYIIKDIKELGYIESEHYPDQTWFENGGWKTIEGGLLERSVERLQEYKNFIDNLPTELRYESPVGHMVILEHAGYTPFDIPHRTHDPLWDRGHFNDLWGGYWGFEKRYSYSPNNVYLVHGHTPVQYLRYYYGYRDAPPITKEDIIGKRQFMYDDIKPGEPIIQPKVIQYCNEHKIDIDLCTVFSGRAALLDLDTFEVKYFDEGE